MTTRVRHSTCKAKLSGGPPWAPIAGGIIVERSEFDALFLVAAMVGLVAVFASGALTDTYVRTRPTAAAWRMRPPSAAAPTGRRR